MPDNLGGRIIHEKTQDADLGTEKELARIDTLYSICLRDYFSTFGAYATATSIVLAGLSFVAPGIDSPALIAVLASIGIYLCFQWHIATTSMRDQYTHFYARMVRLEAHLGQNAMLRWHDAANAARGRPTLLSPQIAAADQRFLTWLFRQIGWIWALPGASMPVAYISIFLAIGLALGPFKPFPWSEEVAVSCAVEWFIVGHLLVAWETKSARRGRHRKRKEDN